MTLTLSPRVTRVRAPNPSPMTLDGTNSYVIAAGAQAVVIDPGPAIDAHLDALVDATQGRPIGAILVTHGHPDHAPGAPLLAQRANAPVFGHPRLRIPVDRALGDGERVAIGDALITAIDAPGHTFDHLVFHLVDEDALFTGDVVLGTGTVVIAPPGGAMRPYEATLARLLRDHGDARAIYGGHGPEVRAVRAKLDELIAHRRRREAEVLAQLSEGPRTIPELVRTIYATTDARLWPAAARQMLAILQALEDEARVVPTIVSERLDPADAAILAPDLRTIVDPDTARVASAELGLDVMPPLVRYALVA